MKWYLYLIIYLLFICTVSAMQTDYKYTLSTGDRIRIIVYGEKDLTLETTLDDDGIISYPFLGDIKVKNLSLGELENTIREGLKDGYLRNPNVNVSIIKYRPFYINGEVKKPGSYPFTPGLTIQQAVSIAGGFTERASEDKIYVIHKDGNNQRVQVNKDTLVRPDDSITVDESFF